MLQHPHPRQTQVTVGPYLQEFFFGSAHVMHLCIASSWTFFCCGVKHKISNQSACIYRLSAPISYKYDSTHVQMMKKKTNN